MRKANPSGAFKLLKESMPNGILSFTEKILKMLKQKHPKPNDKTSEVLMQKPTRHVQPIVYKDVDESVMTKAATLTNTGTGPPVLMLIGGIKFSLTLV